jgi:hypothetical protein
MNILLINQNPVVSRLLALCTRNGTLQLNEVSTIDEIPKKIYDIIFVDESSFIEEVSALLKQFDRAKKIYISHTSDEMDGFDATLKKPFLPSEINDLIQIEQQSQVEENASDLESVVNQDDNSTRIDILDDEESEEVVNNKDESLEALPPIFENEETSFEELMEHTEEDPAVLDKQEIDKIKSLLEMDEEIEVVDDTLSDMEMEVRKIKAIKDQLVANGLEIIEEDKIVEELSVDLDGSLHHEVDMVKKKKSKKSDKKRIKEAVKASMENLTKKEIKKLLKGKEIAMHIKLKDID